MKECLDVLADGVLIEPDEGSASTIVLPDSAKKKPTRGIVAAVGPGAFDHKSGSRVALSVKVDDLVLFRQWAGTEVDLNSRSYVLLKESDVIGVLKKDG